MLLELDNYGEIVMAVGFLKLLEGKLPGADAIRPRAIEVAIWMMERTMTEEEKQDVRDSGLLGH